MGMFDYVDVPYDIRCPECGEPITNWQSKDHDCELRTVGMGDVFTFYALCRNDGCKAWVQYSRLPERPDPEPFKKTPAPLSDFRRVSPVPTEGQSDE